LLAFSVLVAGPVAALPAPGMTTTVVLFRPGTGAARALGAVAAIKGRVVWANPSGELLAIEAGPAGGAWRLYAHGALLVGSSTALGGCLAWSRNQ
jgi:hypothetical protein